MFDTIQIFNMSQEVHSGTFTETNGTGIHIVRGLSLFHQHFHPDLIDTKTTYIQ